jgi:hypothetical protein
MGHVVWEIPSNPQSQIGIEKNSFAHIRVIRGESV